MTALPRCPKCSAEPFDQFLPQMFFCWWRLLLFLPCMSIICRACKNIVGHE